MIDIRKTTQTMLKNDSAVSALVGDRVYLITSKKEDGFPRVIIRESANEPGLYADGQPWEGVARLRLWLWAKTYEEFFTLIQAIDEAMKRDGFARKEVSEDDYIPEANVYEKNMLYQKRILTRPNK